MPIWAARTDLEVYTAMPGRRDWWRVARDDDREIVGFALPSANNGGPVVGQLGVLPEHRPREPTHGSVVQARRLPAVYRSAGAERARLSPGLRHASDRYALPRPGGKA